jgi:FkbM family methyltransferase
MKRWLRPLLSRAGIYYARRQYMPCGIDWLWDVQRLMRQRRLRTVFDVGANIGQTTRQIKARFPAARVHAFEPIGATFETLRSNVDHLEGVTPHRLALSDRPGQVMMTAAPDSPLNHFVEEPTAADAHVTAVEAETIDRFCEAQGITDIDLLKVDAEGADLKVLQGAERLLRDRRVALVFAEVGFDRSDRGHVHLSLLFERLAATGLEAYAFYDYCRLQPPAYEQEGLGLVFANVLFVSPPALARLP